MDLVVLLIHTIASSNIIDPTNYLVGNLICDLDTGELYTKQLVSNSLRVGNSLVKLSDDPIFIDGVKNSNTYYSLVKYISVDNVLRLTTVYPDLSITSLEGTSISSLLHDTYLALDAELNIVAKAKPEFYVTEASDFDRDITIDESTDDFALVLDFTGGGSNPLDYFSDYYYTRWTLKGDASKVTAFEDVKENKPVNSYSILKNTTGRLGITDDLETNDFSISYDLSPELITSLDCNEYSIYDVYWDTLYINPNTNYFTLTVDTRYDTIVIDCSNSKQINVEFTNNLHNGLSLVTLLFNNLTGIIKFDSNVHLENGLLPYVEGESNSFSILFVQDKIIVLSKSINLLGV